jgi:hypothetical protein
VSAFIQTGVVEFAMPILCKISVENGKFREGVGSFVPICGTGDRERQQTRQVCGSLPVGSSSTTEGKWLQGRHREYLIALQPGARIP